MVEAYGVKGINSKRWRKVFASRAAFEKWVEKNKDDIEVHGVREMEQ